MVSPGLSVKLMAPISSTVPPGAGLTNAASAKPIGPHATHDTKVDGVVREKLLIGPPNAPSGLAR
jgi:hypothetical protein